MSHDKSVTTVIGQMNLSLNLSVLSLMIDTKKIAEQKRMKEDKGYVNSINRTLLQLYATNDPLPKQISTARK